MQLEKASSHSGEAGLAGWISTNDVTLFTMVLIVLMALFLHSYLIKSKKEAAALSVHLETTKTELEDTSANLAETDTALGQAQSQLKLTQAERDRLQQELNEKLARIANLDQLIAGLTTEKTQLQSDKTALEKTRSDLNAEKNSLTQDKLTLNQRLEALTTQLEEKLKALAGVEQERERLKMQADELDKIVATLQQKLNVTDAELAAARKLSAEEQAAAAARMQELEAKATAENAKAEDYLARLRRAAELFKGLQGDKQTLENKGTNLNSQLTESERRIQEQLLTETRINRELVGLSGSLRRVAIIFDASGSMKEQGTSGDRWADAQRFGATWLRYLDVDECVLIVFSSDVRTFPADGTLAKVRGPSGEAARGELLTQLAAVEPKGWTNTLDALRTAYSYESLDTIILFSDGAPTNANSGRFDPAVAREIYALVEQHKHIPINSVGLGNYFDQELSTFLRTVATLSGGTFRGH